MDTLLIVTILIQAISAVMVLYTFYSISNHRFPKLAALEEYHLMRKRYERLRTSLLFVSAMIVVQLAGAYFYLKTDKIPLAQLFISDIVVVALIIFLSRIYTVREHLDDMDFKSAVKTAEEKTDVKTAEMKTADVKVADVKTVDGKAGVKKTRAKKRK